MGGHTVQASLHHLCNDKSFAFTMVALEVLVTSISRLALSIEHDFLIKIVDWVSFAHLQYLLIQKEEQHDECTHLPRLMSSR